MRMILLAGLFCTHLMADLKESQNQGELHGKQNIAQAIEAMKNFSPSLITPRDQVPFDPHVAKGQMKDPLIKKKSRPKQEKLGFSFEANKLDAESMPSRQVLEIPQHAQGTKILDFLQSDAVQQNFQKYGHVNQQDFFFRRSESIANGIPEDLAATEDNYHLETCIQAADRYLMSLIRNLQLDVLHEPEEKYQEKICKAHTEKEKFDSQSEAEKWVNNKENAFALDPSIKTYDVKYSGNWFSGYKAKAEWVHKNNVSTCSSYHHQEKVQPERWEERGEAWVYEDQNGMILSKSPDCTLIQKTCQDAATRKIYGRTVEKQCWQEKLDFLCRLLYAPCKNIQWKNCREINRKCLQENTHGCALWEITYKCLGSKSRKSPKSDEEPIFGMNQEWEVDYKPNQTFSEVYTKLKLFEEIKHQLEGENAEDASKIPLFSGKKMKCSKSVADKLLYDCCFSFGGLAKDLKLSQCNEEEIALGTMRENGFCHYVGKYEKDFLDLWKSQDVHVFCCFPSKLARVFQEEIRKQLNMGWGEPEHADCRGLWIEEITKTDFTQLNLSEVHNTQDFEQRLKQKLENVQESLEKRKV